MAFIVLMEDDAATRTLVGSVLRKEGHEVVAASDGEEGLALARARRPDLIVSDVQMPRMNGFQVLADLRRDPVLAAIPVILLTSLQERAHMRIGMTAGADDYITKPFRPGELREAVAAQLNRREVQAALQAMAIEAAVGSALAAQRDELMRRYERRLAAELSERWPAEGSGPVDVAYTSATVLFADIPNYPALAERLSAAELSLLVRRFYSNANDAAYLFGASHMQFVGEGLAAVFADDRDTDTVNHALRAVRTALALAESARGIDGGLRAAPAADPLPAFGVVVALNTGPVTLVRLRDPLHGGAQSLPVGDVASVTPLLQKQAAELGWTVAASVSTLRAVTGAVRTGRRALLTLPGRSQPLDAAELLGLAL